MDIKFINLIAAVASAVAAVASVFVAVVLGRRADAFATAQRRHSAFSTAAEWRRELTGWAAEAVDVLSEASYCCEDEAEKAATERLFICRFRVSALIDRGRFFLPNIRREDHGTDKPAAYRGYRHSALDPLVAAERVLSTGQTGSFTDSRYALIAMKREFVSAIQQILDPEHFNREVAKMIAEAHESQRTDPTLGGLLPGNQNIPRGAEALLGDPQSRHWGVRK